MFFHDTNEKHKVEETTDKMTTRDLFGRYAEAILFDL
jgi:hypothetical protein